MDEDWLLYFITTFTFCVIFIFCYIRHVFTFFEKNRIERATYPTFPFGNVYDVIFQKTPMVMQLWKFYNRFKRKKCTLGGFYIFIKPVILMVKSQQALKILTKEEHFTNVDQGNSFKHFDSEFKRNLLTKICEDVQKVWGNLSSRFKEDEEINFSQFLSEEYAEKILEQFFNVKQLMLKNKYSIFSNFKKLICLSYRQLDKILNNNNYEAAVEQIVKEITKDEKTGKQVSEFLKTSGFSNDDLKQFVICLISNLNKANNLVLFTLFELCNNDEIYEELQGEIIRFQRDKSTICYDNLQDLAYLETVVCETLRKYPLEPFVYKVCKKDYAENNVGIRSGTLVFVSTFGIHHDSQHYVNPELFDPDRFSEENLKFIEGTKYFPFGGESSSSFDGVYVRLLMKITLIELLSKFKFSLGKKSPRNVQFDEAEFETLKMKEDVWLKISKL